MSRDHSTTPPPRRLPAGKQLEDIVQGMLNWPGVNACFVGRKQVGGLMTKRLALVCGVDQKIASDRLDSTELLPGIVPLQLLSTHTTRLATDVIEITGQLQIEATVLGPADIVNPELPSSRATVGIALRHPVFGDVITTAGHAIPPGLSEGDRVRIESAGQTFQAVILAVRIDQLTDHALLRPEGIPVLGNFFRDVTPLGPPFVPDPETDTGTELFVLFSSGVVQAVRCRGLQASLRTAPNVVMHNLILTDLVTRGGDSGTCVVDRNWRVWGLLLGAFRSQQAGQGFSVFIPAFRVLSLENARFL